MARIVYKKGFEGQNKLECIEGIEIGMSNGQYALIYPKYEDLPLLYNRSINEWKAKTMTQIEALNAEDNVSATDELLSFDSSAAKFVRQFKSDVYGHFNLPTLLAAMEIIYQREDINVLAETIEGAELLEEFIHVSSCFRCGLGSRWIANSFSRFADVDVLHNSYACVPTITYGKIIALKSNTETATATCSRLNVIKFLKGNPLDRHIILATLLEDDTISIAELVKQKEESLKKVAGNKTEELANACGLIVRYKDKINAKTVNSDAQKFLDNCSYTGIAGYGKNK